MFNASISHYKTSNDRIIHEELEMLKKLVMAKFQVLTRDLLGGTVENCVKPVLRVEVFTVVTMKNIVFWDVALCRSWVDLKMEAICSSETSVNRGSTQCHIPEENILHV
jgi:hypothetical protein